MARRRTLKRLVAVGVTISLLTVVAMVLAYTRARPDRIAAIVAELSPRAFVLGLVLHLVSLVLWAGRMYLLARPFSSTLRYSHAGEAVLASVFTAALTPGRVGGEPVRYAFLTSHGVPGRKAGTLVFLERVLDIVFFVGGGAIAAVVLLPLLGLEDIRVFLVIGMVLGVAVVVVPLVVIFMPQLLHGPIDLVSRFIGAERTERAKVWVVKEAAHLRGAGADVFRASHAAIPLAFVLTVASWLLEFAVLAVMLRAAGADVAFGLVVLGGIVIGIVSALPLLPGGSGLAEVGAYAVFLPLAPGLSPAFVLGWRAATYYVDLAVGGPVGVRFAGREIDRVLGKGDGAEASAEPTLAIGDHDVLFEEV